MVATTTCSLPTGVLFYGDQAANNVRASDHVDEVTNRVELDAWLSKSSKNELSVLNVSLLSATPCIHIFPAVLALAKNMVGYASFARLVADANDEARAIAVEYRVTQVRTNSIIAGCFGVLGNWKLPATRV